MWAPWVFFVESGKAEIKVLASWLLSREYREESSSSSFRSMAEFGSWGCTTGDPFPFWMFVEGRSLRKFAHILGILTLPSSSQQCCVESPSCFESLTSSFYSEAQENSLLLKDSSIRSGLPWVISVFQGQLSWDFHYICRIPSQYYLNLCLSE